MAVVSLQRVCPSRVRCEKRRSSTETEPNLSNSARTLPVYLIRCDAHNSADYSDALFFSNETLSTSLAEINSENSPRLNPSASLSFLPGSAACFCPELLRPTARHHVSHREEVVFHRVPVRRRRHQDLRGTVRQTRREQGWESGRVRAEGGFGGDGHQQQQGSRSGRVTGISHGLSKPCVQSRARTRRKEGRRQACIFLNFHSSSNPKHLGLIFSTQKSSL